MCNFVNCYSVVDDGDDVVWRVVFYFVRLVKVFFSIVRIVGGVRREYVRLKCCIVVYGVCYVCGMNFLLVIEFVLLC